MMNFNKHILEAINRGIQLALDDYEDDNNMPSSKHDIIKSDINYKDYLEYEQLRKKVDIALPKKYLFRGDPLKITIEEYNRFVELSHKLRIKYPAPIQFFNLKAFIANIKTLLEANNLIDPEIGFETDLNWIDVSEVTNLAYMFENSNFNCDISDWDVSNVTNMEYMFRGCHKFNKDISKWNVSNVISMEAMFMDSYFNGDISNWDVSNVTAMHRMFCGSKFNGDISRWDVSSVTTMLQMFDHSQFNQDISKWDVSNVTNMRQMFDGNHVFNQDLSKWDVSKVIGTYDVFGSGTHMEKKNKPKFHKILR